MMRHRRGPIAPQSEESSDEEDAFAALSKKTNKKKEETKNKEQQQQKDGKNNNKQLGGGTSSSNATVQLPASTTSSMKRHHGASNESRKAKMDALLLELEAETAKQKRQNNNAPPSQEHGDPRRRNSFVPEKKGSFVDPGEEHLTTNIFVGNLAPSITEEQLSDIFRQFGDLYSVKIMWPRTAEERARNRNTGFVCFMNREDAEEAMQECSETDPFRVGKRLMMRWGKNVKKTIKRGTGGVSINTKGSDIIKKRVAAPSSDRRDSSSSVTAEPGAKRARLLSEASSIGGGGENNNNDISAATTATTTTTTTTATKNDMQATISTTLSAAPSSSSVSAVAAVLFDAKVHEKDAIRVIIPTPPVRAHFISMIASFIAKDGSNLERRLIEIEGRNPDFDFLIWNKTLNSNTMESGTTTTTSAEDERRKQEHVFYKWRVYSFCQGDGMNTWRTEPFVMVHPNGRFWIPPMIDKEAAWREEEEKRIREDKIKQKQKRRRLRQIASMKQLSTGRQLEHQQQQAGGSGGGVAAAEGGASLSDKELDQFHFLVKKNLSASRSAICEAMAFCFEKSAAAKEIASLLKDALLESSPRITVETRIARLYLLSDVLFNSQQPGVRNAFLYRTAIENMAPEVFASLGKHGSSSATSIDSTGGSTGGKADGVVVVGRLSMKKLATAVSQVLGAWTNWSVYNPMFMDELQARFEGKEIIKKEESKNDKEDEEDELDKAEEEKDAQAGTVRIISDNKLGDWKEVNDQDEEELQPDYGSRSSDDDDYVKDGTGKDGSKRKHKKDNKELDGGSSRSGGKHKNTETNRGDYSSRKGPLDDNNDTMNKEEEDLDGEPVDDADNMDGEPLDDGIDGESLIDEDLDGEPLSDNDLLEEVYIGEDDQQLDDEDIDGKPLDPGVDGEPLEEEEVL